MLEKMICPAGMHCSAGHDRAPDLVSNACKKGYFCLRGDEVLYFIFTLFFHIQARASSNYILYLLFFCFFSLFWQFGFLCFNVATISFCRMRSQNLVLMAHSTLSLAGNLSVNVKYVPKDTFVSNKGWRKL